MAGVNHRWRSAVQRGICVVAVLGGLLAAPRTAFGYAPPVRCATGTEVVRLGFTTFESAADLRSDRSWYQSVQSYLRRASAESARSGGFECPIEFDVHLGNYYQVLSWFRSGEIDAAVVSAFVAYVIENEVGGIPIVEFQEHEQPGISSYKPMVAARNGKAPIDQPVRELDAFLCSARAQAIRAVGAPSATDCPPENKADQFQLNANAHLSTSTFIAPMLYARRKIDDYLTGPGNKLDEAARLKFLQSYWDTIFQAVNFTFTRRGDDFKGKKSPGAAERPRQLFFSYSGRDEAVREKKRVDLGTGPWALYGEGDVQIPRDVLVLSRSASLRIHGSEQPNPLAWPVGELGGDSEGYTQAVRVDKVERDGFSRKVSCGFGHRAPGERAYDCSDVPVDPILARIYEQWFTNGRYEFSVDDVMTLLQQDQQNSGERHLALVLPGGGVKAAYQSRLLDGLYAAGWLANVDSKPAGARKNDAKGLQVDTIAGTSGGAMVGLFAARPKPDRKLETLWMASGQVQTSASDIFPRFGMLRFLTFYVVAIILELALVLVFWFRRDHKKPIDSFRPPAKRISLMLSAILLVGPVLIRWAIGRGEARAHQAQEWGALAQFGSYVPVVEATVYGFVVFLVHMTWTCCVSTAEGGAPASWWAFWKTFWGDLRSVVNGTHLPAPGTDGQTHFRRLSLILIGVGVAAIAAALLARFDGPPVRHVWRFGIYPASAIVACGVLTTAIGTALFAAGGTPRAKLLGSRQYLEAMGILVAMLVLSAAVVAVATFAGRATMLEIAPQFWVWTATVSILLVAAAMLVQHVAFVKQRAAWLTRPFAYLAGHQSFLGRRMTPLGSWLIVNGIALLLWALFVTPALYDNANALAFFHNRLEQDLGDDHAVHFTPTLVVTGSSLDPEASGGTAPIAGDHYFCFDGINNGCPRQIRSARWHNVMVGGRAPKIDDVVDPVFASGSPFPVLPDHGVSLPGFNGRLVDGGFVHNTPLQAAALTGARQVLIVNSSPREGEAVVSGDNASILSRLAANAARLLPFMFEQSQGIDRDIAPTLTVASLAPVCDREPFPFLADFRPTVVGRMVSCAEDDLKQGRRLGRIDSWGRPRRYSHISAERPGWKDLSEAGWDPKVLSALTASLKKAEKDNTFATLDAAFDMDNTTIQNDFGEALLREEVIQRTYRSDDATFWQLFPDPAVRERLRRAAIANVCAGQIVDDVARWPEACRDYFVSFWKQYEELLAGPGPEAAYAWTAKLFVGQTPKFVEEFAEKVWDREAARSVRKQPIVSEKYGTVTVNVGLRSYPQIESLVHHLKARHWNVWLVSASSEYAAHVVGRKVGIAPGHARGIRSVVGKDGLIQSSVQEPIPYRNGKVALLEDLGAIENERHLTFAAGDSKGDVEMLKNAANALVIDRGQISRETGPGWWWQRPFER